jgi:adenine C2-methylase RlmN of 23S rRNA A2503 and tRNA A37
MAPRRKPTDLPLKSIWDEHLLAPILTNVKHRNKLWVYLIAHVNTDQDKVINDKRLVTSFDDIPFREWCLPLEASKYISQNFSLFTSTIVEKSDSTRGDTTKLLIRLQDGHEVETVVIRHLGHATVCVSSQIGCQMGCKFCATGTMGIIGDLTAGEIVEQLIHANCVTKIRNVVFMGMGEPL